MAAFNASLLQFEHKDAYWFRFHFSVFALINPRNLLAKA